MKALNNQDRLLSMVKMRASGKTFQEIADEFGVSKQYVHEEITYFITGSRAYKRRAKKTIQEKTIYPNLAKWMLEENISIKNLLEISGMSTKNNSSAINPKLSGKRDFKISEIKNILKASGKTFEYMFEEGGAHEADRG